MAGCRMGGQHFDVNEDKHTPTTALLFSQGGLKFHQSWLFGPPFHRSSSSKLPWRREKLVNNQHPITMPSNKQKSGKKKWDHQENDYTNAHCPLTHAGSLVRSVLAQCITQWMPWLSHYIVNAVCIRDAWKRWTGGGSINCLSVGCHRTCSFGTSKPVSGELSCSRWSKSATKRSAVRHATSGYLVLCDLYVRKSFNRQTGGAKNDGNN